MSTRAEPREAQLETFFAKRVRLAGGMSFKLAPIVIGMPDRLAVFPGGKMYLVELKTTTGRTRPAQEALHLRLAAMGVRVVVLKGSAEIIAWVRSVVDPEYGF